MKKVRIGIIGTGKIAKVFVEDSQFVDACEVVAVVSRTEESGTAFAKTYNIQKTYSTYEKMLEDEGIDAIYVATPHVFHKENTLAALKAKKAVLCEKPFATSAKDAAEMVAYAKQEGVLLMEAMWIRYLPIIQIMKSLLDEGAIGQIQFVKCDFGFNMGQNYPVTGRLLNPELGGGALLDVGIYPVSMVRYIFEEDPVEIKCTKMTASTGVDAMSIYNYRFENGALAILYSAVGVNTQNEIFISGTKGSMLIPDFGKADQLTLTWIDGRKEVLTSNKLGKGYVHEIKAFCETYLACKLENPLMSLDETISIMKLMDEINLKITSL